MHPRLAHTAVTFVIFTFVSLLAHALPVETRKGLVVAAHPAAAEAGARILSQGGNAADALVATAFALGVVEPHSSGLGGGGFALLYDAKTKKITALDFREVAPADATPALFEKDGVYDATFSRAGGRSVGVPGAAAGYAEIVERFGRLPLKQVTSPAVALARNGFLIGAGHKRVAQMAESMRQNHPALAPRYLYWGDTLGVRLKQEALAKLMEDIGRNGRTAFYEGPNAQAIIDAVRDDGGVMTLADLTDYRVRALTPLEGTFRGHRVVTMPPPSAGGMTVLHLLGVLDRFPQPPPESRNAPLVLHRMIETWRRSFAARAADLGDPRQSTEVSKRVEKLLSPKTLDAWAKSIGRYPTPASELIDSSREGDDTSHLCVVDEEGNVALMTTTINGPFGSGLVVSSLGLVLNNENDDFSPPTGGNLYGLEGGKHNGLRGGRTPVSTMAPTLVFDGERPWIAVGAAGGSTITTTIAQIVVNIVDTKMNVEQAVAKGRIHAQLSPDLVMVEPDALDDATREALKAMRHSLRTTPAPWGNAQALTIDADGVRRGAGDPRGVGAAVAQDGL